MTTPATENTGYAIICDAMWDSCKLPRGEDPDGEDIPRYMRRLNQLVVEICTAEDGPRLWLLADTPVPLVAGQNLYSFGPAPTGSGQLIVMTKPDYVYDQYYQYPATQGSTRRPIARYSRTEWDTLSVLTQQGPVTQIFVDPQQLQLNVNTWLTPDANEALGQLHLVFRNHVTTFINLTDTMAFPLEWALPLHWLLAHEISNGQPQAVQTFCAQKAAYYLERLKQWDQEHETSIRPQPDQRMGGRQRFGRRT